MLHKLICFPLVISQRYIGPVWYSCGFQNKLAVAYSENKQLTSKAAECLVNWLFVSAVNGRSRGKLFGKLAF